MRKSDFRAVDDAISCCFDHSQYVMIRRVFHESVEHILIHRLVSFEREILEAELPELVGIDP